MVLSSAVARFSAAMAKHGEEMRSKGNACFGQVAYGMALLGHRAVMIAVQRQSEVRLRLAMAKHSLARVMCGVVGLYSAKAYYCGVLQW